VYLGAKRRYINTLPFLSFPFLSFPFLSPKHWGRSARNTQPFCNSVVYAHANSCLPQTGRDWNLYQQTHRTTTLRTPSGNTSVPTRHQNSHHCDRMRSVLVCSAIVFKCVKSHYVEEEEEESTRMWADTQPDGRPVEYR